MSSLEEAKQAEKRAAAHLKQLRKAIRSAEGKGAKEAATYAERRDQIRRHQRKQANEDQDIGRIPLVVDPPRREACAESFEEFCRQYFPAEFHLSWSDCHRSAASKIERAAGQGGLFAFAMPRGSGKSTLCEAAVLWSMLYGYSGYTMLICATATSATRHLSNIRVSLQSNLPLREDFPEVLLPIWALERSAARARQQHHGGEPTAMQWLKDHLVLPTIRLQPGEAWHPPDAEAPVLTPQSGSVIGVTGMTGEIRGVLHKTEDGASLRPDLVICDDPQTRESARSPTQCEERERIIAGDICGLAGPTSKISVVMPCTVIYQGDLADRMLDRETHPEWQGERTRMVEQWPPGIVDDEPKGPAARLWEQYADIRRDSFRGGGDGREATEFYREHQEEMDAGFVVSWEERRLPTEVSAIQHAMNLYLRDETAFRSEYQNDPVDHTPATTVLTDDEIQAKAVELPRGVVPAGCRMLTAFIDVQAELLYWMVVAWEEHFTGHVVDYGAWPDQGRSYFSLATVRNRLSKASGGAGLEGAIYAGLDQLTRGLCGRQWQREDGAVQPIERLLVDANWGQSTSCVYKLCTQSPHKGLLLPAHGIFVGASSTPWSEYKGQRGEQIGHHWRLGPSKANRGIRRVLTDVNYWKSFLHARLATAIGDHGSLTLCKGDHRMLSEHLNAEYPVRVQGKGRELDEWKQRPDRPDNHLFDCAVGCAVAASIGGLSLMGTVSEGAEQRERRSYKLSDLRSKKRNR